MLRLFILLKKVFIKNNAKLVNASLKALNAKKKALIKLNYIIVLKLKVIVKA